MLVNIDDFRERARRRLPRALFGAYRAVLGRWYPIKLGLELAGTPEREILRDMGAFLDANDDNIAEALRAAS